MTVLVRMEPSVRTHLKKMFDAVKLNPSLIEQYTLFTSPIGLLPIPQPREGWERGDACAREKDLPFKVHTKNVLGFYRDMLWDDSMVHLSLAADDPEPEPGLETPHSFGGSLVDEDYGEEPGLTTPHSLVDGGDDAQGWDAADRSYDAFVRENPGLSDEQRQHALASRGHGTQVSGYDSLHPQHLTAVNQGWMDFKTATYCTENNIDLYGVQGTGNLIEEGDDARVITLEQVQALVRAGGYNTLPDPDEL